MFVNFIALIQVHRGLLFFREPLHGGLRATESQCDRWPRSDCVWLPILRCVQTPGSAVLCRVSVGDMEDRIELRSRALARNKRDLTAVTEIPAASATSLLDL